MGFLDRLFGQKDWETYVSGKHGFQVSYPKEWSVREREDGIDIHPPDFHMAMEPELGVEIPTPGVHIAVRDASGRDGGEAKDVLRARSNIYEDYRVLNHIGNDVPKAESAVVYEFAFTSRGTALHACSVIARKGSRIFDIKACENAGTFEAVQKTFRQIVKGFKVE
ncbi:MAG: hypothetical protein HPY65_05160 [Syntrophaceae bacterium]|nr:hypothetical protein [Syntrophaceae bacterium]